MRSRLAFVSACLLLGMAPAGAAHAQEPVSTRTGTVGDSRILEASGLARSTFPRKVMYVHNDSGDSTRFFAIGRQGRTRAVYHVDKASALDWEDMSVGRRHALWIGDIGDNSLSRPSIAVYRVVEPRNVATTTLTSTKFTLTYPDGAHDAEGLMVKPTNGRLFVVTKSADGGGIYRAPRSLSSTSPNPLRRIANAPARVTAADFATGGKYFVLRNYSQAFVYHGVGSSPRVLDLPRTQQGESVAFGHSRRNVWSGSEGTDSPLWKTRY